MSRCVPIPMKVKPIYTQIYRRRSILKANNEDDTGIEDEDVIVDGDEAIGGCHGDSGDEKVGTKNFALDLQIHLTKLLPL